MTAKKFEPLAAHLSHACSELMASWRTLVRDGLGSAGIGLTDADLDDHLPSLVYKLADALRVRATPNVEPEGAEHGRQRRAAGYTVPQILLEFRMFRQVLMNAVREYYMANRGSLTENEVGG